MLIRGSLVIYKPYRQLELRDKDLPTYAKSHVNVKILNSDLMQTINTLNLLKLADNI